MKPAERIPTNMRMLIILEALGNMATPATPSAIGRAIGLSKQTTHRLCTSLVEEGFLVRDANAAGLRPGRRMRMLAAGIMQSSSVHVARHQVLKSLAAEIGETVNFVVPEDRGMTYQDRVETDWPFRIQLPVGTHVPFHCTASGKTYLASLPKAERTRLVNVMSLDGRTNNSITDPQALLEELSKIAKDGYAIDNEEFVEGMVAMAVPVKDLSNRYFAAIAFHGPIQRIDLDQAINLKQVMQDASKRLSAAMFAVDESSNSQ